MIETRLVSLVLVIAAIAVAIGATQLLQMVVRDILDNSRRSRARKERPQE